LTSPSSSVQYSPSLDSQYQPPAIALTPQYLQEKFNALFPSASMHSYTTIQPFEYSSIFNAMGLTSP